MYSGCRPSVPPCWLAQTPLLFIGRLQHHCGPVWVIRHYLNDIKTELFSSLVQFHRVVNMKIDREPGREFGRPGGGGARFQFLLVMELLINDPADWEAALLEPGR